MKKVNITSNLKLPANLTERDIIGKPVTNGIHGPKVGEIIGMKGTEVIMEINADFTAQLYNRNRSVSVGCSSLNKKTNRSHNANKSRIREENCRS